MVLSETRAGHRTTREAYERMVEAGAFVGRRVELGEGIVCAMTPQDASISVDELLPPKA